MQKDRHSFLSSELLITALFVPLRAVGVTAPSCLHPSCRSFVVDTHKSCIAVTYSVMRRLRATGVLGFTRRFLPFPRAGNHLFRDGSPFLSLPPACLVSSVTVSS